MFIRRKKYIELLEKNQNLQRVNEDLLSQVDSTCKLNSELLAELQSVHNQNKELLALMEESIKRAKGRQAREMQATSTESTEGQND